MAGNFLRKSVPYLYLGGGAIAGFAILYPNTFGLEHYQKLMTGHTPDGREEKVDFEFMKLFEEIKKDYQWSKKVLESTEITSLFTTSSLEFFHLGTSKTTWGCQIGIPKYYYEKTLKDSAQMDQLLKSLEVDPSSQAASDLKRSFEISHAAKKFALAREMKLSKNYQIYFIAAGAQVAISSFYLIPNFVSAVLPFPGVKFITLLSLFPLWYIGFFKCLKASDRFVYGNADKAAASISMGVAQGGLEYYNSLLLRQKWIETSKQSEEIDGKKLFEEIFCKPWNFSFLTLQERKEHLKQFIDTLSEKKDN